MEERRKRYSSRIEVIKEEFDLSDSEVEEMEKFLSRPELIDRCATFKDILEDIIKTDILNDRQKVAFAYSIGMFQMERDFMRMPIIPTPDMSMDDEFGLMRGG